MSYVKAVVKVFTIILEQVSVLIVLGKYFGEFFCFLYLAGVTIPRYSSSMMLATQDRLDKQEEETGQETGEARGRERPLVIRRASEQNIAAARQNRPNYFRQ